MNTPTGEFDGAGVDLWRAINEYAEACGGDTWPGNRSDRRMRSVSAVCKALAAARPDPIREAAESLVAKVDGFSAANNSFADVEAAAHSVRKALRGAP